MSLCSFIFGRVAQKCSKKKGVLKNFTKFTGKNLCQGFFLIKLQACNFITLLK